MIGYVESKDPNSVEPYFFIWCDEDGTNTGADNDKGVLQGATISTSTTTVTNATEDSENLNAVTLSDADGNHVSYDANTVVTVWISGGTVNTNITVHNRITTSDSRTLDKTMIIPVKEH